MTTAVIAWDANDVEPRTSAKRERKFKRATKLERDAMTEGYSDVKEMIHDLVYRFCRRYRTELEEATAIANEAFVEAWLGFDPQRGATISTHICTKVCGKLLEWHRTLMRRHILGKFSDCDPLLVADCQDQFFVTHLLDSIGDDAKTVIRLAIDSPRDIIHALSDRGGKPTVNNYRKAIKEVLNDFGWSTARIAESFAEIGTAIQ